MGIAVSDWRLARSTSQEGALGVVSGTSINSVLARRLLEALERGDTRTVVNDLRELRPIVRLLVLNYG